MACSLPEITVYNGTDNVQSVLLGRLVTGVAEVADLTTTTRITLRLFDGAGALAYTVDSVLAPAAISWAAAPASGQVDLKLGGEGLAVGAYRGKLVVYSPSSPAGELFAPVGGDGYALAVSVQNG